MNKTPYIYHRNAWYPFKDPDLDSCCFVTVDQNCNIEICEGVWNSEYKYWAMEMLDGEINAVVVEELPRWLYEEIKDKYHLTDADLSSIDVRGVNRK